MTDGRLGKRGRRDSRDPENGAQTSWAAVPEAFRNGGGPLPPPWEELFGPLRRGAVDELIVVGQCGQSIDAPHRHPYRPFPLHQRRGRACPSASAAGIGRRGGGRRGHRDRGRSAIDGAARRRDQARRGWFSIRTAGCRPPHACWQPMVSAGSSSPRKARRVHCPRALNAFAISLHDGQLAPPAIIAALAARGFRRILVEGGADTVSRFVAAGCLDRLHVLVAPIILGAGRSSLTLAPIERVDEAVRAPMRVHLLGERRAARLRPQRSARAARPGEKCPRDRRAASSAPAPDAPAAVPAIARSLRPTRS